MKKAKRKSKTKMKVKDAIEILNKLNPEADLEMFLEPIDDCVRFAPVINIGADCSENGYTVYIDFDRSKIS